MDEATSNIDVESENKIMEVLYELSKEKLVLCISHRLANLIHADQIYCLKDGNIVEREHMKCCFKRVVCIMTYSIRKKN